MTALLATAPYSAGFARARTTAQELAYLIANPGDSVPPVVSNFAPANGATIAQTTPISFDVTEETALRKSVVHVAFATAGVLEVAWDGAAFGPSYAAASSRAPITGGYRYTLLRAGGWPSADLRIDAIAIDRGGNEA